MRINTITLVSIFILIIGCKKADNAGDDLELRIGHWTAALDLQLSLAPDIQDSRCPLMHACFWEGEATGIVLTDKAGAVHEVPFVIKGLCLPSDGICGNTLDTLGYRFVFMHLLPHPVDQFPLQKDYRLIVKVSEL